MALIEINKNPSKRELQWFGLMLAAFLAVVGTIAYWRFAAVPLAQGLWIACVPVLLIYYAVPAIRLPIYLGWLYATYPIGWTISHIVMAAVYYGCFTPIGWILRLVGYDPLTRKKPSADSYWIERPSQTPASRYFRQF